jgi:hypothetical protein
MRKRPPLTASGARQTRKVFGDADTKELPIPTFIFWYNHYMCGVDIADQLRSYFTTQRTHRRTWKPLFHFLLDTVLGNCFLLSSYNLTDRRPSRKDGHKQFRKDLRDTLFKHSIRKRRAPTHEHPPRRSTDDIIWVPTAQHELIKLFDKEVHCSACIEAGRRTQEQCMGRRKALSELSPNTTRKPRDSKEWKRRERAPRTHFGCSVCKIPFCRKDDCWRPHIERLNSKD